MQLRTLEYLSNIEEYGDTAISANLKCACGASEFRFFHTGKQTKGIFAAFIVRKQGQLVLKAECPRCQKSMIVFDSTKDGVQPKEKDFPDDFAVFASSKVPERFPVRIKYNYQPENFKSNRFESCFVYIVDNFLKLLKLPLYLYCLV